MSCFDGATVSAFVEGRLGGEALEQAKSHALECERCASACAREASLAAHATRDERTLAGASADSQLDRAKRRAAQGASRGQDDLEESVPISSRHDSFLRGVADAPAVPVRAVAVEAPTLQPGASFGRYRIESHLGRGGMGTMHVAFDTLLRRRVALKLLRSAGDGDEQGDSAARLLREARAAAALSHPNAVAVYDVGQADGAPFIAMELVDGETLRARMRGRTAPVAQRIRWLNQIARALDAAHRVGLVHRDIKPENVLVCADDSVKVLDFGIAKRATSIGMAPAVVSVEAEGPPSFVTREGQLTGTPRYMAPEQLEGATADARSDQYAWAVVAFELLTGAHPTDGGRGPDKGALLGELAPDVPLAVVSLVQTALAREPALRLPSMSAIVSSLEASESAPSGLDARRAGQGSGSPDALGQGRGRSDAPTRSAPGTTTRRLGKRASSGADGVIDSTPRSLPRAPASRGSRGLALLGVAILLVAAATASTLWTRARAARATVPATKGADAGVAAVAHEGLLQVLLHPFEIRAPEPLFAGTLDHILDRALYASDAIESYAPQSFPVVAAEGDWGKLTRRLLAEGARVVVVDASVDAAGRGYRFVLRATEADSDAGIARVERTAAGPDQVVSTLTELTGDLRAALGDPVTEDQRGLTGLSASLEADHDFSMGVDLTRTGEDEGPVTFLERAIARDPDFNEAHFALADALYNVGRFADSTHEYALAARPGRLSPRLRLSVLASQASMDGQFARALGLERERLRRWPHDVGAALDVAETLVLSRSPRGALEVGEKLAREVPTSMTLTNVVAYRILAGDAAGALQIASEVDTRFPHRPDPEDRLISVALALLGRTKEAEASYHAYEQSHPAGAAEGLADLALFDGRLDDASTELGRAVAMGQPTKQGLLSGFRAELEMRMQHRERALDAADKAAVSAEPWARYLAGSVYASAGLPKKARALAAPGGAIGPDAALVQKLLIGVALRAEHQPGESVAALQDAVATVDAWLGHLELARSYLAMKDRDAARRELELCRDRRGEGALAFPGQGPTLRYVADAAALLAQMNAEPN